MDIITECNASDMNKKEWMRIHNISPKNFYRWQKVLRERALNEMEDYGYPILPAHDEEAGKAGSQEGTTNFVDITGIIAHEAERKVALVSAGKKEIEAELILQVGSYNLYIAGRMKNAFAHNLYDRQENHCAKGCNMR